jgi:hypothetical protein
VEKAAASTFTEHVTGRLDETQLESLLGQRWFDKWCEGASDKHLAEIVTSFSDTGQWKRVWSALVLLPSTTFRRMNAISLHTFQSLTRSYCAQWTLEIAQKWTALLRRATTELGGETSIWLDFESLVFCLSHTRSPLVEVVSFAFPVVYDSVSVNRWPKVTDEFFGTFDWDKAKKLRKDLIEAFMQSNWAPDELAIISVRCQILRKIVNRLHRRWKGEAYLSQMIAGLRSRSGDEARQALTELTGMLDDPNFFEPWD